MRNDSKGIQLEIRYLLWNEPSARMANDNRYLSFDSSHDNIADQIDNLKKRKHTRSYSCDVKIGRSNSREYDPESRNRRVNNQRSHSRNNSRDLVLEGRQKPQPTHSRTSSRDEPINVKYIFNCIKPEGMLGLPPPVKSRKHSRNHSYDQIYSMPNNIKFDHDLTKRFNKNCKKSVTSAAAPAASSVIENDLRKAAAGASGSSTNVVSANTSSHSRNNSKDLNKPNFLSALVDDAANSILRHRRTNSKDLNRILATPSTSTNFVTASSESGPVPASSQQHRRNISQTKIEFPEEESQDAAASASQVLLQPSDLNANQNQPNSST